MKNSRMKQAVLHALKKNAGISVLLVFVIAGFVIASLVPPQILRLIIDHNFVSKSSKGLLGLALAYMAFIFLTGLFDFTKEAILTVLGQSIVTQIRAQMMEKLEKMKFTFFSAQSTGTVVSRFTNDVDSINTLFTGGIIGMAIDCLKIIGIVISIALFSSKLGLVTLLLLPVIYVITRLFQKRMLKAQIENRILVGRVNNHIAESLKNILMIKSTGKENYMENNYTNCLMDNYKTVEKVNFYDSIFSPIIQLIRAAVIGSIVVLSSKQLNFLGISLGMVAASIDLISSLFAPIESLGMELQDIQQAVSGIRRVNDFFSESEDAGKNPEYTAENILRTGRQIELQFHDVSFYYDEGTDVLQNISLTVCAGETVTFTGRTGVGKSTLFKLILGLFQPTSGSITVNGVDVYAVPNSEKRKIYGYVDQSFPMVKGTIGDQISLQDSGITREQICRALNFVGMSEYISSLEKGIDTVVTNDTLFSQGQKQLLAIARAIVTDPPMLLLDEITASLDSLTEKHIVSVLQKASGTHMILSISHRLSSMLASDTVVILENGRIKNTGSPEELLQKDDWYRSRLALEKLTWS